MQKPVIEVQSLSRFFKVSLKKPGFWGTISSLVAPKYKTIKAVDSISFDIQPGEVVGFIGPNGAGKTTTLKMLSGLLHPTSGKVKVAGFKPFERKNEFKRKFAIVLGQKSQLWWDLPAIETLKLNRDIYDISDADYEAKVEELTTILDIKDKLDVQVRRLSLGQRMKFELIAALIHNPQIMFLDEPTIGLDIVTQHNLRDFLRKYNEKAGTTIMLTSHNMDDVQSLCKRIIVINEGKLIYDGEISKLIRNYSPNKYLTITFLNDVEKADLEKYGSVEDYSGSTVTLATPRESHTKIAAEIISKLPVDDLDIHEPRLDEVIAHIYKNQVNEPS